VSNKLKSYLKTIKNIYNNQSAIDTGNVYYSFQQLEQIKQNFVIKR